MLYNFNYQQDYVIKKYLRRGQGQIIGHLIRAPNSTFATKKLFKKFLNQSHKSSSAALPSFEII